MSAKSRRKQSPPSSGSTLSSSSRKVKKLTLQLVPETKDLKESLKQLGANPFVQISFKPSKTLSFIVEYILSRRYGAHISEEMQRSAPVTLRSINNELSWTRGKDDNVSMRDVFGQLSKPEHFRLKYEFDWTILQGAMISRAEAAIPKAPSMSASELFEARNTAATKVFDVSNASLLGAFGDVSLGVAGLDGSSFHFLGTPVKLGPLAASFRNESENSFSTFLGASNHGDNSLGLGIFGNESMGPKKNLFK